MVLGTGSEHYTCTPECLSSIGGKSLTAWKIAGMDWAVLLIANVLLLTAYLAGPQIEKFWPRDMAKLLSPRYVTLYTVYLLNMTALIVQIGGRLAV